MRFRSSFHLCVALSLALALSGCGLFGGGKKVEPLPELKSAKVDSVGRYPALITYDDQKVLFTVLGLDRTQLDPYSASRPETTGRRLAVFLDLSPGDNIPDYCLFVYREAWTLRERNEAGAYVTEVAYGTNGDVSNANRTGSYCSIPRDAIRGDVLHSWHEMPANQ